MAFIFSAFIECKCSTFGIFCELFHSLFQISMISWACSNYWHIKASLIPENPFQCVQTVHNVALS